jgi:3',5'-cyclic AMP phosphodiesterase CpdA
MFKRELVFIAALALASLGLATSCNEHPRIAAPPTPPGTQWSFVALGDSKGSELFEHHVRNIENLEPTPDFMVHLGDTVAAPGNDLQWKDFERLIAPLKDEMKFYVAPGNHDITADEAKRRAFERRFDPGDQPFFAFDDHDMLGIVLSTEEPGCTDEICEPQLSWLKQQLDNADAPRIVVFMHRPMYPQGHYRGTGLKNADQLHQLFVGAGVGLVFAGHEHQFFCRERDGVAYIISGGGGAALDHENGGDFYHFDRVCVGPEVATLQVIGLQGEVLKSYEIPF